MVLCVRMDERDVFFSRRSGDRRCVRYGWGGRTSCGVASTEAASGWLRVSFVRSSQKGLARIVGECSAEGKGAPRELCVGVKGVDGLMFHMLKARVVGVCRCRTVSWSQELW